jgi:periplasmic divalent cation tolerance protein
MVDKSLLVMTNMPDAVAAHALARQLVESKLAACVNLMPGVQSVYRWQGSIEEAAEVTLFVKTTERRYDELEAAIRAGHPYDLPEIIAVRIAYGSASYQHWIAGETQKDIEA